MMNNCNCGCGCVPAATSSWMIWNRLPVRGLRDAGLLTLTVRNNNPAPAPHRRPLRVRPHSRRAPPRSSRHIHRLRRLLRGPAAWPGNCAATRTGRTHPHQSAPGSNLPSRRGLLLRKSRKSCKPKGSSPSRWSLPTASAACCGPAAWPGNCAATRTGRTHPHQSAPETPSGEPASVEDSSAVQGTAAASDTAERSPADIEAPPPPVGTGAGGFGFPGVFRA